MVVVVMDAIERVERGKSKYLNELYLYHCTRSPGFVLEFCLRKGNTYYCASCRKLSKQRCITITADEVVVTGKRPEDDHHPQCKPQLEAGKRKILNNFIHQLTHMNIEHILFLLHICKITHTVNAT